MAEVRSRCLWVHTSTAQLGGAEISLLETFKSLEALKSLQARPHFLVPEQGPLVDEIKACGFTYQILAWPKGLKSLTQRNWLSLIFILPGILGYLLRLLQVVKACRELEGPSATLWSSGFKSHCACIFLTPWLGPKLVFDIRDFLHPLFFRKVIAKSAGIFKCRIRANSRSVAKDYPGAEVHYPRVLKPSHRSHLEKSNATKIVVHLAFFAPYKGQDLFLSCARKILDAGIKAEFWMLGDVIYPGAIYQSYRDKIFAQAEKLGLQEYVKFMGKVPAGDTVQKLLAQAHLLLHCTRQPEPFGRVVLEALYQGCEVIAHGQSGVCEVVQKNNAFPEWIRPLQNYLGSEYVSLALPCAKDHANA